MLVSCAIIVLTALNPQADRQQPAKIDLSKWKPGPNVAQELARLDHDGKQIYRLFREGKIAQLRVIRELARLDALRDSLRAWSFENHSDEVPQLVVIIDSEEYTQVFPRGIKHLPIELVPGELYASTPGSSKLWQYLGRRQVSGMRLSVFRYAVTTTAVSSQHSQ